jgi:excisionase family DNA binding protein
MATATETPWLTIPEAAAYMKYSTRAIRLACREGKLRHTQVGGTGGKILTTREWLDEWAFKHQHGGE